MIPEMHRGQARGKGHPRKPDQPKEGPRVNPKDPVEEASYESFPASDPPAFGTPRRGGEVIPPGQPVPKADAAKAERKRSGS